MAAKITFWQKLQLLRAYRKIRKHLKQTKSMEKWNSRKLIFTAVWQALMAGLMAYLTGLDLSPEVVTKIITILGGMMGGQASMYVAGQSWIDRNQAQLPPVARFAPGKPEADEEGPVLHD